MVKINGAHLALDNKNLLEYLNENGYSPALIAVELNGENVPKSRYESTVLSDGDSVEIVSFVGGG